MKKYMVGLLVFISVATSCFAGQYDYYFHMVTPNPDSFLGRIAAPFQAGYKYTDEQKKEAYRSILKLELEKQKYIIAVKPNMIDSELQRIEDEIYQQKLITGDAWSTRRKALLGSVGLAAVALMGFGVYKYLYQSPSQVDLDDVGALRKRLADIEGQKYLRVAGRSVNNPAYKPEEALKAQEALNNAIAVKKEFVAGVPYESPDLVADKRDVQALRERLGKIREQKRISVPKGYYDYENPNFNEEDLRVAEKQYYKALDFAKFNEGIVASGVSNLSDSDKEMMYSTKRNIERVNALMGELKISSIKNQLVSSKGEQLNPVTAELERSERLLDFLNNLRPQRKLELLTDPNSRKTYDIVLYAKSALTSLPQSNQNPTLPKSDTWYGSVGKLMYEALTGRGYDQ